MPKPRSAWLAQATDAGAALEPHTPQGTPQRDHAAIDHDTVALLSEALAALTPGQVSQERQDLAGLRPVGEVRGMPDVSDTRLDAGDEEEGHPMDSVDITPTPAACWQIARPFRAQWADAEALAARAAQALATLDATDDDALAPWDRALLATFAALHDAERARVRHMDEGLEAWGPSAEEQPDDTA